MDLELHGAVVRRYWVLFAAGIGLAVCLAVLSYARPTVENGIPRLEPRDAEVWQSNSTLLLTLAGFQEGRAVPSGDLGRLYGLSDLYARLATSDEVRKILSRTGRVDGSIEANSPLSSTSGPTPLIALFGKASTSKGALQLTRRATIAFVTYLNRRQREARIPENNRVRVRVLREAQPPLLIVPRTKTLPMVVFLAVLTATFALVYVLENMRRRRDATAAITVIPEAATAEQAPAESEQGLEPARARRWA